MPKEREMKTFTTVAQLAEEISKRRQEGDVNVIGIDGKDGSGKSWLAAALAETQAADVISLDDYLERNQGGYTRYLDITAINQKLSRTGRPVILEGVCLLAAAELIGIDIDIRIYVKRMSPYGTWRDEEECDPALPPEELIAERNKELEEFAKFEAILDYENGAEKEETADGDFSLPKLEKELIRYHAQYRPASNADCVFERSEDES
ncbi:hypothetical protein [Flexistipes sp.]|uniref:hypothetical protein n=1 Tax=Flexistipes sp. TaxID=3088135 RepID=UPI002E23C916|nr:hypothetical protein [Flexistipes sp.]